MTINFQTRRVGLLLAIGLLLVACGPRLDTGSGQGEGVAQPFIPVLAASELAVGQNRLPLGIVQNGRPLNDPNLKPLLRFYYLDGPNKSEPRSETEAVYRGQGLPVGLYIAYPELNEPGAWAVEVQIQGADGKPQASRMRIDVLKESRTPAIGSQAIASKNLTAHDVPDLKQLSSDAVPDPDLYQLTVAEALAAKKPFMLAFSTPGFCKTAVCGPNLEVMKKLKNEFKDRVNFIHIEVYPYPFSDAAQKGQLVPAMEEWRLESEPWTFLVDSAGIIQAKYEGGITFAEMEPALGQLVQSQPIKPLIN